MAGKKIFIEYDIDASDLKIAGQETLSLTQQLRILKKELQKADLGTKEFEILRRKIGDTEDAIARTNVKSKDFFGVLSTLPGPVGAFGGLTLLFDNKIFFYMKPTIVNLIFAVILLYGEIILKKPLLKNLFEGSIKMTDEGWNILNRRWLYFFIFLALLNEIIWRTQSEEFWVQFKVFGLIPITVIFTIMQVSLIQKYRVDQ